jgi:single-strand DNA-binding protein
LAINRKYKDADGQDHEECTFLNCTAFGRTGEVMAQHLEKGAMVLCELRPKNEQWEDKQTGQKRSAMKFIVESFSFCGSKRDGPAARPGRDAARPAAAQTADPVADAGGYAPPEEDSVPF